MRVLTVFLTVAATLVTGWSVVEASTWIRAYGRPQALNGRGAVAASDGGAFVHASLGGPGEERVWVAKIDADGDLLWQRSFAGYLDSPFLNVTDGTSDGGVVLTATRRDGADEDWLIVKLSSTGVVDWQRAFDSSLNGGASIKQTADGGYVANNFGRTVLRLDSAGNEVWSRSVLFPLGYDAFQIHEVVETPSGSFAISAWARSVSDSLVKGYVATLDSMGNPLWQRELDDNSEDIHTYDLDVAADGAVFVAGDIPLLPGVAKFDGAGNLLWSKSVSLPVGSASVGAVEATPDGGCLIAGADIVTKLDSSGDVEWSNQYGDADIDIALLSIDRRSDGTIVGAGPVNGVDASGPQASVLSLDASGGFDAACSLFGTASVTTSASGVGSNVVNVSNSADTMVSTTPPSLQPESFGFSELCSCTTCVEDLQEWYDDDSCLGTRAGIHDGETQGHTFWSNDEDWVVFNACGGTSFTFETSNLGAAADTVIDLYDPDCATLLASDDNGGSGNGSLLGWTAPADGFYHVLLRQADATTGADRDFDFTLSGDTSTCTTWAVVLGDTGDDIFDAVEPLHDGTFIAAGDWDSPGLGGHAGWFVRLGSDGSVQWDRSLDGVPDAIAVTSLARAEDGSSLAFGGFRHDQVLGDLDALVGAIDTTGALLWSERIDDGGDESVDWIEPRAGGEIDVGIGSDSGSLERALVARFDGSGTQLSLSDVVGSDGTPIPHSTRLSAARWIGWSDNGSGDRDFWIAHGNDTIGGSGFESPVTAKPTLDGGHIVLGLTTSLGSNGSDLWIMKLDASFNPEWDGTYGATDSARPGDVVQTHDGGYAVAGAVFDPNYSSYDLWVFKLDASGTVLWQKVYGENTGDDRATSIRQTPDGGFVVSGWTESFGAGGSDGWVLRLDAAGNMVAGCPAQPDTSMSAQSPASSRGGLASSVAASPSLAMTDTAAIVSEATSYAQECFGTCNDGDGDSFGSCSGDCDDGDASTYPGAPQICDGVNNDCDDATWPAVDPSEQDLDMDGVPACANDCDDADPNTYPDAPEINDGLDNQCPGDTGHGLVDEISGQASFSNPGDPDTFCWTPQPGATRYEVARSSDPDHKTACTYTEETSNCHTDPDTPAPGEVYYYLVHVIEPLSGSWGADAGGNERFPACGVESFCDDGLDNDGDGDVDCADSDCADACVAVYEFDDTSLDDVASDSLLNFFQGLTVAPTDFIYFGLDHDNGLRAWCAIRADWYRDSYVAHALGDVTINSGSWDFWYSIAGSAWTYAPGPRSNRFGMACGGFPYSWCSEEDTVAGLVNSVRPTSVIDCEASEFTAGGFSQDCAETPHLAIRVGSDRIAVCGF